MADNLEPSDTEDYEPKKTKKTTGKRLRKLVDDEAGEEKPRKKKGKRIQESESEEDEYDDDPEEGTASDQDFIASESEDSPSKHRAKDRAYELKVKPITIPITV